MILNVNKFSFCVCYKNQLLFIPPLSVLQKLSNLKVLIISDLTYQLLWSIGKR